MECRRTRGEAKVGAWTMAYEQHIRDAGAVEAGCAVVTLSDTRTEASDKSGQRIKELLSIAGHKTWLYRIIPDDPALLEIVLKEICEMPDIDVILTNGGTGISRRDQTIDVIARRIATPLPGFGELFRMLSWDQVGSGAMLSRATAGISEGKLIFAMPGSTCGVELAMEKLILPELGHLLREIRKP